MAGLSPIKVDVRIIAATNRNLLHKVAEKRFREDLFYRLNVFPLTTPPLRERSEDIPLLVYFLIEKFASRIGRRVEGISAKSLQRLQAYRWPGNIRELKNVIERAIILSDEPVIEVDPDTLSGSTETAAVADYPANSGSLDAVERQHIMAVLEQTNWIIEGDNGAARILELHPSTLRYRMKKLAIAKNRHQLP